MPAQHSNGQTAILVIHEIYGMNRHMTDWSEQLKALGYKVYLPDLLAGHPPFDYTEANEAYRYFTEQVGFEQAAQIVKELAISLRPSYDQIILIGCSVGATIAWLASEEEGLCDKMVGFYGSRIRDYLDHEPHCPSLLLFPERESSFDVHQLIRELRTKANVHVNAYAGEHGFADQYSNHYLEESAKRAWDEMLAFIQPVRPK
ncbi:dienelactone hydrolase family protein [Brevibacillus ginsengisoli]|uniref:dienelactone hydrolase family protein n=1 Tax=Brevibacillus ginsengisoli TaxID=363854 RepID=UPI003CF645D0